MKKILIMSSVLFMLSCGNSYEKSPEDWSTEICDCIHEKGVGAQECDDLVTELKDYYAEDDWDMHDQAIHQVTLDCPAAVAF